MIDINLIRKNPKLIDDMLVRRGKNIKVEGILDIDNDYRKQLSSLQDLQSTRNELAKKVGILKTQKAHITDIQEILNYLEELKKQIPSLEHSTKELKEKLDYMLLTLPNILDKDVPHGVNDEDNVIVSTFGEPKSFDFTPLPHHNIGINLAMMDFEQAAKVSGSRFVYLYSDLAELERALANFMIDTHINGFGYKLVSPPLLVNESSLVGTGQLPKFEGHNLYKTDDNKYLIPTSEVSLVNIVRDKILKTEDFPLRFVAHTPCFRLEAGASSQDTQGIIRQHQFSKVELISIVTPEKSTEEHERMTNAAQEILRLLELPFRTVILCGGDTGNSATKTYDIEVWLPSQKRYREISSCSNCLDYQARRMKTRFYQDNKKHTIYPHTLNGSGVAVGRALLAVIENYQCSKDGNIQIEIPHVLQPYMNGKKLIEKKQ